MFRVDIREMLVEKPSRRMIITNDNLNARVG